MGRVKTEKCIITFPNTTAAMAMDAACPPDLGRLIPVPGEVHAGCGLAWCGEALQEQALREQLEKQGLAYEKIQKVWLY